LANMLHSFGIRVYRKHFAAFAKQMHQVPPVPAPGIEHAHALRDISAQDLIEDVNIDLAELFLDTQRHDYPFLSVAVPRATVSSLKDGQIESLGRGHPMKKK
jgi:hypothetical protein